MEKQIQDFLIEYTGLALLLLGTFFLVLRMAGGGELYPLVFVMSLGLLMMERKELHYKIKQK